MLADGTFEFKLRKSIEVAGCHDPVTVLTFHECGEGYDGYYMKLRKFISSGQIKAAGMLKDLRDVIKEAKDDNLIGGDEVKPLHQTKEEDHDKEAEGFAEFIKMSLGTSDDLEELVKVFGFMVSNKSGDPICTTEGVRILEGAWKRLHPEDKIDAAVKYCAFFGIGLDKAFKNVSEAAPESLTVVKVL